jgi:tetratricopeptide (TPR) repeat protein
MTYRSITRYATLTLVLAFFSTACKQEWLEVKPQGELTTGNFFQEEDHAVWATNAVYSMLRDWNVHAFNYIGMTDIVSDDTDKGSLVNDAIFLADIDNFTLDAGHQSPAGIWNGYYQSIYRANVAIENIPNIPEMNETLRARLIGECKFLRAYYYFNLVRWFGDIPLITRALQPDEYYTQIRTPAAQVYQQIIQDLTEAAAVLPPKSQYAPGDLGRASQGAAKGILAKVYLTMGDFTNAEIAALEVINSGQYALYPNYAKIFQSEGEHSSESVFEVSCTSLETGGGGSQYNQVQGVRGTPNLGWGFNQPTTSLRSAFETGDPRRNATILEVGETLPDGSAIVLDNPDMLNESYNQKAWVPSHVGFQENSPGNIRLLRYADVLLMAAEALNENGKPQDALTYLNMVRARAKGSSTNPNLLPPVTITDKDQLRQRIWNERRVELALEQHRWFDLVRQGRAAEVMQAHGKINFMAGKHELFPIPQSEIDLSGGLLSQNPFYE